MSSSQNHLTLLCSIVFTYSCPVAKYELTKIPVFGRIGKKDIKTFLKEVSINSKYVGKLLSAVWVKRDDQEAKNKTVEILKQRCTEKGWPQLLIFPEGTNTNGKALVRYLNHPALDKITLMTHHFLQIFGLFVKCEKRHFF